MTPYKITNKCLPRVLPQKKYSSQGGVLITDKTAEVKSCTVIRYLTAGCNNTTSFTTQPGGRVRSLSPRLQDDDATYHRPPP